MIGFRNFSMIPFWLSSWWFQPVWKICSSNWIISPGIGVKINKSLKPPPSYWSCIQSSVLLSLSAAVSRFSVWNLWDPLSCFSSFQKTHLFQQNLNLNSPLTSSKLKTTCIWMYPLAHICLTSPFHFSIPPTFVFAQIHACFGAKETFSICFQWWMMMLWRCWKILWIAAVTVRNVHLRLEGERSSSVNGCWTRFKRKGWDR